MITTPIDKGVLQNDINFAGHKPINADLSDYTVTPGVFLNVKNAPYNSVGDGVADDTVSIQSAINDVHAAGGGTVFFPQGTYLCNGAFNGYSNGVLNIPLIAWGGTPKTVVLLGDAPITNNPTGGFGTGTIIKTTKVGSGTAPSLLAGSDKTLVSLNMNPVAFNMTQVHIRNLGFLVHDVAMYGVRLDGIGWASVQDCVIASDAATPGGGTVGLFMPNTSNFAWNNIDRAMVIGFDIGIATGEHLRVNTAYVVICNIGVQFNGGYYPCVGNIIGDRLTYPIKFAGSQPVDLTLNMEHNAGSFPTTFDVLDPSNFGRGWIRYVVANAGTGNTVDPITVSGGANLHFSNLYTGDISTVAKLPGTPSLGQQASVNDGTAALAWGATVTGGGATKYRVCWNGANWTVIGK